jgi:hypothetical protein
MTAVNINQIVNAHKILVAKSEGKEPVRRPRHRWR